MLSLLRFDVLAAITQWLGVVPLSVRRNPSTQGFFVAEM